jgi:hypothetical protein
MASALTSIFYSLIPRRLTTQQLSVSTVAKPPLSKRGCQRLDSISNSEPPDDKKFYDEKLNPDGPICLSIAENSLMSHELLQVIFEYRLLSRHEADS